MATDKVYMRQCGPVVRALAWRSGDPGLKTRSDQLVEFVPGCPSFNFWAALVNRQLDRLLPVTILNSCRSVRVVDCVTLVLKKNQMWERPIKYACMYVAKNMTLQTSRSIHMVCFSCQNTQKTTGILFVTS